MRVCPVNAIQVKADQPVPRIMPGRCIGCGSCIAACKPACIGYLDSKESTRAIISDRSVPSAVIVDPTIAAEFPDITDYRKFVSMLRELGFTYVNEVSFGADLIAAEYAKLLKDFRGKYYIMSNDPVAVGYIEKFQPGLIPNLAPLITPAVATARVVRKKYGPEIKVVYVGPLIALKKEEERGTGDGRLDAVLTFAELRDLFLEFRIEEKRLEFSEFDPPHGNTGALFPIASGIVQAAGLDDDLVSGNVTTVEGELELKEALREFEESTGTINSHFNLFYTEYLMGPGTTQGGKRYIRQAAVKTYARKRMKSLNRKQWEEDMKTYGSLEFQRSFVNDDQRLPYPTRERILEIMQGLKKEEGEDIGCGACGYNSCREFAVAIAKGLAIPEMCNNYTSRNRQDYIQSLKISNEKLALAEKALRDSELVARKEKETAREASEIITSMLQKLPSGLVILDEKLKVLQANQSFITMLGDDAAEINEIIPGLAGADLKTLLPYNIYNLFSFVLSNNENIQNRDITFRGQLLNLSAFVIRKGKIAGGIFRDMYSPEVRKEEVLKRVSEVIDKNLSLVQQIGFLLGEGASETEKMLHSIIDFYKDKPLKRKG